MRLYQIIATGSWFGTQADAKSAAKQAGCSYEQVEVPTDKPGLLRFLNVCKVGFEDEQEGCPVGDPDCLSPDDGLHIACEAPASDFVALAAREADEIQDFILNRATVAQVENIFACIGTRFAEQRRAE